MTDLSIRKKKKITITASSEGVKIAENALIRLGFDSKSNFATSHYIGRSTVTKFFQCQPIQLDSFKKICQELKLDWRQIAGLSEEGQYQKLEIINNCDSPDINEGVEPMLLTQTLSRQVTVIDKDNQEIKAVVILKGEINSGVNFQALESILRIYSGDTVKIIDIKEGSIKLFVEGSQEDIARLVSRIKSGELKEVSGFPVEDVQILSESSEDDESNELNNKWCLVREIVTQGITGQNLSGVDLSDADLSGADLRDADLRDADLSDTNLGFADLSRANLSGANLSGTNLIGANLSGTHLRDTDLSRIYLRYTYLRYADLRYADLSRIYLRDADLRDADLRDAYLRDADLIGADLSGANLSRADLSSANLSGVNLSSADLSHADLSGADLSKTKVDKALFRANLGISESMKQDLIKQGAIFEDSPGDRSEVLTKV